MRHLVYVTLCRWPSGMQEHMHIHICASSWLFTRIIQDIYCVDALFVGFIDTLPKFTENGLFPIEEATSGICLHLYKSSVKLLHLARKKKKMYFTIQITGALLLTVIKIYIYDLLRMWRGPGSSVRIATGYGLEGPGIESRWRRDFSHLSGPEAHPASCTMGTGCFPGVKSGRGLTLTSHPLLVPWSRMSTAIPLLPLWAVRPVESLSACTRVHFTFTFTTNSLLQT